MIESNIIKALSLMGARKTKLVNGNVMCNCVLPLRHERGDSKASLSVKINPNGVSVVYCFGCHFKGTIVGLAYELERSGHGGDLVKEVKSLEYGGSYKPAFKPYEDVSHLRHRSDLADLMLAKREKLDEIKESDYKDCFGSVPKYVIEKRGISIDAIKAWKVGHWKRGRQGVFFPIYDSEKRFVGFTIRWIFVKKDENPYYHMKGMNKTKVLYGENLIDRERSDKFVIVEGPFDALKIYMAGYNPLATIGGDFSDVQMSKILNLCKGMKGFAMTDGDKAGRMLYHSLNDRLKEKGIKIKRVVLEDGEDPGSMELERIKKRIEEVDRDE